MSNPFLSLVIAIAAVVAVPSLAPIAAAGQAPAPQAQSYTPPRTADGQPDMQGFWARGGAVGMATYSLEDGGSEAHLLLSSGCAQGVVGCERSAAELAAAAAARRKHVSIIVDPPDGKVPYQSWAAAKRKDITDNYRKPRGLGDVDPQARCFPSGVPRMNYEEYTAFQIHQIPGYVVIAYEVVHAYRIIPLDGRPHVPENVKLWMGDSRGRWEGNTLVVDVTNHNDQTWFDIIGTFHSDALHVVERWTLVNADTIDYEATIEDPKVFTRPWKIAFSIERKKDAGYELVEMACHEGERSVRHMLGR